MAQRKNNQADAKTEQADATAEQTTEQQSSQNTDPETSKDTGADTNDTPSETVTALALVDNSVHGLTCGGVGQVPAEVAEQLEADGVIDRNEKAIASGKQPDAD